MGCLKSLLKTVLFLAFLAGSFFALARIILGPEPAYISENPYTCEGSDLALEEDKSFGTTITLKGNSIGCSTVRPGKENHEELFFIGEKNEAIIFHCPDYVNVVYDVEREPDSNIFNIKSRNVNEEERKNQLWAANYEVNIGRCKVMEVDTIPLFRKQKI